MMDKIDCRLLPRPILNTNYPMLAVLEHIFFLNNKISKLIDYEKTPINEFRLFLSLISMVHVGTDKKFCVNLITHIGSYTLKTIFLAGLQVK